MQKLCNFEQRLVVTVLECAVLSLLMCYTFSWIHCGRVCRTCLLHVISKSAVLVDLLENLNFFSKPDRHSNAICLSYRRTVCSMCFQVIAPETSLKADHYCNLEDSFGEMSTWLFCRLMGQGVSTINMTAVVLNGLCDLSQSIFCL